MGTTLAPPIIDFDVDVVVRPHETVAFVTGEIDLATCARLRDAIEPHLGPDQQLVLDLAGVHFMGSICLSMLLKARTTLSADGGSLILRNPSAAARTVLSAAGVTGLFDIEIG
jgi:anti-anti-sigma factor